MKVIINRKKNEVICTKKSNYGITKRFEKNFKRTLNCANEKNQ